MAHLIFCINEPVPTPCLFLPCTYFYTWDMGRRVKFKNVLIRGGAVNFFYKLIKRRGTNFQNQGKSKPVQ
jgi:hypothetical protein